MKLDSIKNVSLAENSLKLYSYNINAILNSYKNIEGLTMKNENITAIQKRILADLDELYKVCNKNYFTEE